MSNKKRVSIEDVTQSALFAKDELKILLDAGVRAVQCTPLFTRSGRFLGIISSHYRKPYLSNEFDLQLLDLLVRQAADFLERTQNEQKLAEYAKNLEKRVEERTKQLHEKERLAAIGATAGMVGHDIRNPLQAITSDVYLAKLDLDSMPEGQEKEDIKESLDSIEKNVDYVNKIVQDLQDYSRSLVPRTKEIDLERICNEVLAKKAIPDNIKVTCIIKVKKILVDPHLLRRILSNMVNNAVQAMPNDGKIVITAYQQAGDTIITVEDTGVGIPEEIKPKLFTPLFTTKAKGQGFGLAVVKRMIEALGGTITFKSKQGKGTKFILKFPPQKANHKKTATV
jgi:signal transduction histidine kinase